MDLTRKQVIKNLNALNAVCGQKDFYDKEMKESMRYAISSLETDEAYQIMYEGGEIFTKADMVEMLTELKSEIEKVPKYCMTHDATCVYRKADEYISDINNLILQKINALKENAHD